MTADQAAIAALCLYAAVAAAAVAWQAWRCPSGPMIWWLFVAERLACGLLWRVRGVGPDGRARRCPFPQDSGALIVANHRSPADPVLLWQNHHLAGSARRVRPIGFLMAREFYDNRWLNWFYRAMRAIPVTRGGNDAAAVREALRCLKAGDLVGLFPEGGINHGPPGLKAANPGVAFLALSTDAPVYPVYIDGSPVGTTMVNSVLRSARVRLIYGDPIDLSAYRGRKKSQELLREVTDLVMNAVARLGGVEYAGTAAEGAENPPNGTRPDATVAAGPDDPGSDRREAARRDCVHAVPATRDAAPSDTPAEAGHVKPR
ncbi:MAG TPA: lysophospholipid acyltransferase family protein [Planctomycetaceae bacterium]